MDRNSIITLPHPDLRERSKRIGIINDDIKQLIADMEAATLDWEDHREHEVGVALAAVQIDKLLRIIVVRNNFEDKTDRTFTAFINPEVVKHEGEPVYDFEGCLSVKDLYGRVPRYPKVKIKALTVDGEEVRITTEDFLARVFQHEIDHTHGKLFTDLVEKPDDFHRLTEDGKLIPLTHDELDTAGILR